MTRSLDDILSEQEKLDQRSSTLEQQITAKGGKAPERPQLKRGERTLEDITSYSTVLTQHVASLETMLASLATTAPAKASTTTPPNPQGKWQAKCVAAKTPQAKDAITEICAALSRKEISVDEACRRARAILMNNTPKA